MSLTWNGRVMAVVLGSIVVIAVGVGLWVAGSPAEARLERLDQRRVNDLRTADGAIDRYWRERARLPLALDSLPSTFADGHGLKDPTTELPYEYQISGDSSYTLCATFDRASQPEGRYAADPVWVHPAGHHCFSRIAPAAKRDS